VFAAAILDYPAPLPIVWIMSKRAASIATITWTIPSKPEIAAGFGPTHGGDDAWAALEAALAAAWIVRVDEVRAPAALRDALNRTARARDCYTLVRPDEMRAHAYWVWWAHDPAADSRPQRRR
jgi:hypothetical protein